MCVKVKSCYNVGRLLGQIETVMSLATLSDATHLEPNVVAESALGYSTVNLARQFLENHSLFFFGINRRKDGGSGNDPDGAKYEAATLAVPFRSVPTTVVKWKPEKSVLSHDEDYDEGQTANTTDNNRVHQTEELWKSVLDLKTVIAEAKEFLNLLGCMDSTSKIPPAVEELHSREPKDRLPSLEFDAFDSHISIEEQKPMMATVKQGNRERDKILAESVRMQNLDNSLSGKSTKANSGISVVVQEETLSEDSEDELSSVEFNVWQLRLNRKDECSKPSSELDEPLNVISADGESAAMCSYRSINEYGEYHKELINLEIVRHDQPQGHKVMQALKLFKEEYDITKTHPHLEATGRVKDMGKCVSNDKPFGHIPGIEIGDAFRFRGELFIVGLHRQYFAGIDYYENSYGKKYATSVVNSGVYANKAPAHDILIYCGQGGNPKVSKNVVADQKLERGNLALVNSMEMGYPVRVIQKRKCLMTSTTLGMKNKGSSTMYMYDGLYTVNKCCPVREGEDNILVYKFELQRLQGQPIIRGADFKLGKQREVCVLNDVSQGKENFKVRVLNAVDDDLPLPFTYITNIVYPHWYKHIEPIGCNCINGCSDSEQCHCVIKNGGKIPFTEEGALLKPYPNIVHECGPSCKCPTSCMNRVSQHGPRHKLEIFKTKSTGWGVRSRGWIMPGSFICEYMGELVRDKEADQRIDSEYLYDIYYSHDEEGGFEGYPNGKMKVDGISLDAAKCGNISRFINHSCDPNLFAQQVLYDKRTPRVMFFAANCITPRRELRYDYHCRNIVCDANGNMKTKACHCGSSKCSGRMF